MQGCENDGCYAFTVEVARYKTVATPVHEPLCGERERENYSHIEVREILEGESILAIPPRNRKTGGRQRKVLRLEWRVNIVNHLQRLIEPVKS